MSDHQDFTDAGILYSPNLTFLGMPVPEKADFMWYAVRVEARGQPRTADLWRSLIEQIPPEHAERAKQYLRKRWLVLDERERLATVGKRSAVGDAELAKIGALAEKL